MDTIKMRIFREDLIRKSPRLPQQGSIGQEIGEAELRQPTLDGPQHIAGTTQAEIGLGDLEAVGSLLENFKFFHGLGIFAVS